MSIYFDYEVGPSGRRFRRAVDCDKYEIMLFWNKTDTELMFGDVDVGSLIELSVLAICMINEANEVIGFMALSDHPNVRGVDPANWEYWIRNMYQKYYLSRNTLFAHFMCCVDSVTDYFVEEAFISVFMNDCYLNYILIVVPIYCPEKLLSRFVTFKKRHVMRFQSKITKDAGNYLLTSLRADFCPKLRMRRAVEEDNDDIVEILHAKCTRLKEQYGEYYISEILGNHPESNRKIIVADIQGRAVAVMGLNSKINYEKLQKIYELKPFHGLRVATPLEKQNRLRANVLLTQFGESIMDGKWGPFSRISKSELLETEHLLPSKSKSDARNKSKVLFQKKAFRKPRISIKRNYSSDIESEKTIHTPSSSFASISLSPMMSAANFSVVNFLDEDPFDYDIVNIDKTLLQVNDVINSGLGPKASTLSQGTTQKQAKMKFRRLRKQAPLVNIEAKASMEYCGQSNAFMIELFAFRHDIDPRNAFDLLEAAFELYKEYDYCIIRVPSSEKSCPLLQHFCLVPSKNTVCCRYDLYVAHRSSVMNKLRVREAELVDIPGVAQFLHNLQAKETIWNVKNIIVNDNQSKVYVFICGNKLIGLGIIDPPEQLDFLRSRFNIDSYHIHKYHCAGQGSNAGFGIIKCVIMYPAFEPHSRFFIREMMRLSGYGSLLWVSAYRNKFVVHKANAILTSMIPLVPLHFTIDNDSIPALKTINALSESVMAFSAWYVGKKYTTMPKVNVTSRIVIVGASRTAFGFLNTLIFGQTSTYLTFTSVTLISTFGLPYTKHSKPLEELMFPKYHAMSEKYLKSVPYTYYVNLIEGTVVEIDLHEKFVSLTNGGRCHYDLLFLFLGTQYQHPDHMTHLMEKETVYRSGNTPKYVRLDDPNQSDTELHIISDECPTNLFIVNSIHEASQALNYVKRFQGMNEYKIIVYGATIHAYLCINTLLKLKVPAKNILFFEPFPSENPRKLRVPLFCNSNVDLTVNKILVNLGVKVYKSYYLQSWTVGAPNIITHADFLSYANYVKVECSAMFYYGKRGIDMKAFVAIHKSGLAYDGGIVIDHECRTLDPYVYAAGPATRYHRKYYAQDRAHKYYHSYDVGEKLGELIRNNLDPLFKTEKPKRHANWADENTSNSRHSWDTIAHITFLQTKQPKTVYCELPGGFKYLDVRSPGKKNPHYYVQSLGFNGYIMETFKQGYFKIHMTKDYIVDGITCLTHEKFSLENFTSLYGHSASVLNNVHWRYHAKKLDNFYKLFRAPWAYFLYHPDVEDLFAIIKQLVPKGQSKGLTLHEALNNAEITLDHPIRPNFETSPHMEAVSDYLMEWLVDHDTLLLVYLHPNQLQLYEDHTSPMFYKKQKKTFYKMLH